MKLTNGFFIKDLSSKFGIYIYKSDELDRRKNVKKMVKLYVVKKGIDRNDSELYTIPGKMKNGKIFINDFVKAKRCERKREMLILIDRIVK